jgi:hypothetical protein
MLAGTLASLVGLLLLPAAWASQGKNTATGPELEARLLKALAEAKTEALATLAGDVQRLTAKQRKNLTFRLRPGAVEFRFLGECPGHRDVEFVLANKNRDYEALLVISQADLERADRLWKVVRQLAKAGQLSALEFKLLFVDKGQARLEDLEDVFHKIDAKKRKDYYVRFLEWEDDGLRIRDTDMDPALVPAVRQPAQIVIVVRPAFLDQ